MYITLGWRGTKLDYCDHEHETRDEAEKCLVQHQNEARKAGKTTNRQVVEAESLDDLLMRVL